MTPSIKFHSLQKGKYQTVVADPPWPYNTRDAITRCYKTNGKVALGVGDTGYQFLGMRELKRLEVGELATPNAHLYLWTTNAFIVEAHELARAWGFQPKTIITWVKVKEDGSPSMKTGYYFRGATEHILFCVRGSLRLTTNLGQPTIFFHRRLPHSVKPKKFFRWVEKCSPGPYLELFARRRRSNWDAWGNEV